MRIYGIYDLTAETLLSNSLILLPNDAAARRLFADSAQQAGKGHILYDHLDEFIMVNVADFDTSSGVIIQEHSGRVFTDPSRLVLSGKTLIQEWERLEAQRSAGQTDAFEPQQQA